MEKRRLSARELIFDRDDYTCYLCGKKFEKKNLHVDHIYPFSKGGQTSLKNLKTCCKTCNLKKHDKEDFSLMLEGILVDPDGESFYFRPDILNKFDIKMVVAAFKFLLGDNLPNVKVGIPNKNQDIYGIKI